MSEPPVDGWRRQANRIAVYSPCAAALLTLSFVVLDGLLGRPAALRAAEMPVVILNWTLAVAGSAVGGLLQGGPVPRRVILALVSAGWGFVAYYALAGCLGAIAHRW